MSIQSFTEKLLSDMDKLFEKEANTLLNEAKQQSPKAWGTAGRIEGITNSIGQIRETYSLFVKTEEKEEDENKALY